MDFEQVLKEVLWRLVTEGSVSYRRIKRGFDLDDDALDDVRRELIGALHVATDLDGEFLVLASEGRLARPEPATLPQLLPALQRAETPPVLAAERELPGAERRHLTVMFCDLADSTHLSARLDPEDMGDVIRAYQEAVSEAVRSFDGYIAKFMGDGVLIYFGYPNAQEKDAERAVRAGLAILGRAAGAQRRDRPRQRDPPCCARRHRERDRRRRRDDRRGCCARADGRRRDAQPRRPSAGPRRPRCHSGQRRHPRTRRRHLCLRGSRRTRAQRHRRTGPGLARGRLARGGGRRVRNHGGFPAVRPRRGDRAAAPRLATDEGRGPRPGRLRQRRAGIGKSALVDTLRREVRAEGRTRITFRCSPYHTNSALYPLVEHWKRLAAWQPEDDAATRLAKLESALAPYRLPPEEAVPLFASLLSLPLHDAYPRLDLPPQQLKEQTANALVALSLEEAEREPLLMVWEDVHWADPSTSDLLGQMIDQAPTVPLSIVLTLRPEFALPWPARSHVRPLTLSRLERPQIEVMATRLAGGKELPAEVFEHVVQKTDGVPLFVEEMTKAVLGSSVLRADGDRYMLTGPLSEISIPASLHESLMARLDRLPTVREVAQLGAVLGREMLRAIATIDEPRLRDGLGRLVEAELLYQRGRPPRSRYIFKHALIQDAAYQSLLRRTRQQYHRQVAELLESDFADTVEANPELVAHHYSEAGLPTPAVIYWQRAGEKAARRSANQEAVGHPTAGLSQLAQLPETQERAKQELALQQLLGQASLATKGGASPEATRANRKRHLCPALGMQVRRWLPTRS